MSSRIVVVSTVMAITSLVAAGAMAADDEPVICAPPKKGQAAPCGGADNGKGGILPVSGRSVKKGKSAGKTSGKGARGSKADAPAKIDAGAKADTGAKTDSGAKTDAPVKMDPDLKADAPLAIDAVAARSFVPGDRPDWVRVPAGTFQMGTKFGDVDERPVHKVTLPAFLIARTEVTVAQYERCVKAKKCRAPLADPDCNYGQKGREDFPVNCVNRAMAADYATFVGGRLPTEAEWEYAAGLGEGTVKGRQYVLAVEDYSEPGKPKNPDYSEINDYAWYRINSGGKCHPVATRKPSSVGLYDMLGNVMEWVSDWMGPYTADPVTSPTGPLDGSMAQVRGGGWNSHGFEARIHDRQYVEADATGIYLGFRPVKDLPTRK